MTLLVSLLYMGGILNPRGNLHDLPIGIVNADRGAAFDGAHRNLGSQISHAITTAPDAHGTVSWQKLTPQHASELMGSGKVYAVLQIPADFTASVASLTHPTAKSAQRPALTVLTNPGVGSMASSLAGSTAQQAAAQASRRLGHTLTTAASSSTGHTPPTPAAQLLMADPIAVTTTVGHPIGSHSGAGLTAFYYTLLLVLTGFISATVVSNGVDAHLGYAVTDIGPWHIRRPPLSITRIRTFAVKATVSTVLAALTSALLMLTTIAVLGMDATHLPLLYMFSFCATTAVALGVQAINAAFGSLGQLVGMLIFFVLALPSSGATVPLQAIPGFYRFLAHFEPMRQLNDAVRAILYFDARADAGLTRGWTMIGVGSALALLTGLAVSSYYDRKGLRRLLPDHSETP
ncbi:YhgE/Pip domain-containing protein [Streptomyces cinereospinus]|uniref:YhgE/Pip domain-containing protein n=1 Tax=Streptomyces cinereospinus TaxID=285561 RepID=A0ABV5MXR3_9ACTN